MIYPGFREDSNFDQYVVKKLSRLPFHRQIWIQLKCFLVVSFQSIRSYYTADYSYDAKLAAWLETQPYKLQMLFWASQKPQKNNNEISRPDKTRESS
jgi:hypothetical protein